MLTREVTLSYCSQFTPSRPILQVYRSSGVICIWSSYSYLCPSLGAGHLRLINLPSSCWLLLLSGDVEVNPGPVRYPCTSCNRPVQRNQMGIFCNRCELWTHVKCCGVSRVAYDRLSSEEEDSQWLWFRCFLSKLAFAELDEAERDNHPCPTNTSFLLFDSLNHCFLSPVFCPPGLTLLLT